MARPRALETVSRDALDAVLVILGPRLGDRLTTAMPVRDQHGRDASYLPAAPPDAVAYPRDADEVVFIVTTCHAHGVPVIPFGTGTSCEGHVAALRGGICLDMSQMDAVGQVSSADRTCRVEPGVTRKTLNAFLRDSGLFFPVDPGADASIGGMISTRASGTNAVRYGTMADHVVSLDVVLADGTLVRTSSLARKSAAGYNLTQLMVGAEGTLGVIVAATVRLHPIPEAVETALIAFPSSALAIECAIAIMGSGIPVARMEYLDDVQIRAVERYSKLGLSDGDTLIVECSGDPDSVARQMTWITEIASDFAPRNITTAQSPEDRSRIWKARHDAWWAAIALRPGAKGIPTDSCVPVSRLAEAVAAARKDCAELGVTAPICSHVGDGNFHLCVVFDPENDAEARRVDTLLERLSRRAIALGGTITGEHGIGYGKRAYLVEEHGLAGLQAMAAIKRALDPRNIMNPGKILEPGDALPFE
ncbi:FAD-binding oxidoreductase [Stappia sp. ES.058]|uniref:FAD-binding oxidoreductase n=1 Tax=Stappia sp. ES.058 TaxID=1881061 RepID=UPI00087A6261|nr:FAD-linked oxidase C-terminal domain-containing protein [Stappia sp. ES.058]SDU08076.1 D-lactate dehydrogenase (cytochrome) [Stappia sp. ES.058]